jgi:tetratricopeptide (TPR) repeat protein
MTARKAPALLISLISFGLTAAAVSPEAKLPKEQIYALFAQANEAFKQAHSTVGDSVRDRLYEEAILLFEKIINDGRIRNAGLYYNLGNAYFLKGELGKAILNYRRAQRLDKTDVNIQKNLSFARSRRMDKVKVKTEKRVLQTLFFWHYDFSMRTKFAFACLCFAIVCVILTLMVWFGGRASGTVTVATGALLTIMLLGSVVLEFHNRTGTTCGVITAREVLAHQADWQGFAPSFKEPLHAGTEFDLIEHRRQWLHIKLSDGSDGWIPQTSAELI